MNKVTLDNVIHLGSFQHALFDQVTTPVCRFICLNDLIAEIQTVKLIKLTTTHSHMIVS